MATQTPMWREVSAKKKDIFERHGVAMLNLKQVAQEFGCKDERTAKKRAGGSGHPWDLRGSSSALRGRCACKGPGGQAWHELSRETRI